MPAIRKGLARCRGPERFEKWSTASSYAEICLPRNWKMILQVLLQSDQTFRRLKDKDDIDLQDNHSNLAQLRGKYIYYYIATTYLPNIYQHMEPWQRLRTQYAAVCRMLRRRAPAQQDFDENQLRPTRTLPDVDS